MLKKIAIGFVALLVVLLVGDFAAELWGKARLEAYDVTWQKAIAAEQERLASIRMPVLRGTPLDENAAPRYQKLMDRVEKIVDATLSSTAKTGPGVSIPPSAAKRVAENQPAIAQLREAVRCTRCNWEIKLEDGPMAKTPKLLPALVLTNLLVIEGHQRAAAGDPAGAAERYLDAARFGADFGAGMLIMIMVGETIEERAMDALGRLIVSTKTGTLLPLADLDRQLARLEPVLPSAVQGFRSERLWPGSLKKMLDDGSWKEVVGGQPGLIYYLVPRRALVASMLPSLEEINSEAERAAATEDRTERAKIVAGIEKRARTTWNPLVAMAVPNVNRICQRSDMVLAKFRLVRTAIAIEQHRSPAGLYPPAPAGILLPVDPLAAPARLHYQALSQGKGYRIWSVGDNGKDDGGISGKGTADDLTLERGYDTR